MADLKGGTLVESVTLLRTPEQPPAKLLLQIGGDPVRPHQTVKKAERCTHVDTSAIDGRDDCV